MRYIEANFDGLVGPTHNYAGLSLGNIASCQHAQQYANPRDAAKQGLKKAKLLADLGLSQAILPPQHRPDIPLLKRLGFSGTDAQILTQAREHMPELLQVVSSASSMWAANAATVSPSLDTLDAKVHFTPANLLSHLHRSIETRMTTNTLKTIFSDTKYFKHHQALPAQTAFSDEGAANHTRLSNTTYNNGVEVFVYGQSGYANETKPKHYPARQTLAASQAIARLHRLVPEKTCFIQQNPDVIDAGVFHNDVIAVGHKNLLFFHEKAFVNSQAKLEELQAKIDEPLHLICVPDNQISVATAVNCYLFNSQIVSTNENQMILIAPIDCQEEQAVHNYLINLINRDNPINDIKFVDVKQSMKNGGGPACLRLRVLLNEEEKAAIKTNIWLTDTLFKQLNLWIDKYYRDRLSIDDLADAQLLQESQFALDELTQILNIGSIYDFQID